MIAAAEYARTNRVPYFGICLGMQIAAIEFARNVLGYEDANSSEFDPESDHPVIALMEEQMGQEQKGGTMRLGAYPCRITPGTKWSMPICRKKSAKDTATVMSLIIATASEYTAKGAVFSGQSPDGNLVEAMEVPGHPFYVGVQYHPEFKSRPNRAHPLFREFIKATSKPN